MIALPLYQPRAMTPCPHSLKNSVSNDLEIRNEAELLVKNGFSDPTKEKVGQDWQGKDIMNDHQGKALREGCRERE